MTELQIGLIGLGTAAVVGVLAYNKWQEHRHRKVAEQVIRSNHDDVLLTPAVERREPVLAAAVAESAEPRLEPMLDDETPPWAEAPVAARFEETPGFSPEPEPPQRDVYAAEPEAPDFEEADDIPEQAAPELPAELLDPRIDFIAVMELVEPVPAEQILYSQHDALVRIGKPVHWIGFNDRQREWEVIPPNSAKSYRRLRIGLQLADRRGPLSEADFTVFVAAMQQLADELMAVVDMSPHQRLVEQAVEIDRFCAEVDLEIGVHLITRGTAFPGTKIRALAEAAGMVLGDDGLFTRHDENGNAQFRLQNLENIPFSSDSMKTLTTRGLTFLLDVPRVDHGERVFFQMVDLARRFADALQGMLVDDNRQPLVEAQLDRIKREYVVKTQAAMAAFGLPAGSPQALRLFS